MITKFTANDIHGVPEKYAVHQILDTVNFASANVTN